MKLKALYQEIIKKGMEADIRSSKEIGESLKHKKEEYDKLQKSEKDVFDQDALLNPYADTRILNGDLEAEIKSIIAGIDINESELLLIDRLRDADKKIDLAISHHPTGRALASLYDVMDLQVDVFHKEGVSLSAAQNLLAARKAEIQRRLNPINHQKIVDIAKWLKINLLCMHTPCDNLAYQYIRKLMDKERPATVARVMEILNEVPEYKQAAGENNPVMIEIGTKSSRVNHIHVDFTGGTEGPDGIYEKLSNCAVDTIIAMHQSEEHFKKCKEHNLNVIVASHIASDNLGVNLMLDHLGTKADFKVYEVGGFRRFPRKK